MASVPTPRSRSQIIGEIVDSVTSRTEIGGFQVGSPQLSFIEAAATSDARGSQDTFQLLASNSLERAQGEALDRIGAKEQTPRLGQIPSSGWVDIFDTSFVRIATSIYQGGAAPAVGTVSLLVESAASFAPTGSLYIGRGTSNYEGPIPYSAVANAGAYWTITLVTGTTKTHNLGEGVVLAQGGNRAIPVGTLVRTPQGNASTAVQFAISFTASIPDGETETLQVPARARVPGSVGNVPVGAVTEFVSPPFIGAGVSNPAPFANGLDTEDDSTYRERIRAARQSKSKGTSLAVQTSVLGLSAPDENNRILSAHSVRSAGGGATLYIDDGTGYEHKTEGVAFESIVASATGGEKKFQLVSGKPVEKAALVTTVAPPFRLTHLSELAVEVGGTRTSHLFVDSEFASIANATAHEVASAINADASLGWVARTTDGATKVSLSAKASTNEEIQVVEPAAGNADAGAAMGFPTSLSQSLWLYRNDQLLSKDGRLAALRTKPQSGWGSISSGDTLLIEVDGIPLTITISDASFVAAKTPYAQVSATNSLASWAAVLNRTVPGITASVSGSSLVVQSNRNRSGEASVVVTGGAIGGAMFAETAAFGDNADYTLNRNIGLVQLSQALASGERLSAGSLSTRGFLEAEVASLVIASEPTSVAGEVGAELWVVVDGAPVVPAIGTGPGTDLTVSGVAAPPWGVRVRYTSTAGLSLFGDLRRGDWVIATDVNFDIENRGAFRVVDLPTSAPFSWVEVEQSPAWASPQALTLSGDGFRAVRTDVAPQRIFVGVTGNPYTATSLAREVDAQVVGGAATVYRTTRMRVRTNTFDATKGSIVAVAANAEGVRFGLAMGEVRRSGVSHLGSVVGTASQKGTPGFDFYEVGPAPTSTVLSFAGTAPSSGDVIVGLKSLAEFITDLNPRWGNQGFESTIEIQSTGSMTLREAPVKQWLQGERFYAAAPFALSARDSLGVVLDGDEISKRYVMNTYRKVTPTTNSYGAVNVFRDTDGGGVSLAEAFGTGFDWRDFAVHMKARAIAGGILWRFNRHGAEGNYARVGFGYPTAPSLPVGVTVDARSTNNADITISLAGGAPRTLANLRPTGFVGQADVSNDLILLTHTSQVVFRLEVASAVRNSLGQTTLWLTLPVGVSHGIASGQTVWIQSADVSFTTGPKFIINASNTSIQYMDIPGVVPSMTAPMFVSYDSAGDMSLAGAGIVVGDLVKVSGVVSQVTAANDNDITTVRPGNPVLSTAIGWTSVPAAGTSVFPLDAASNSTSAIVTAANAVATSPVTGLEVTPGTITAASGWTSLSDGLNFVRLTNIPTLPSDDFVFTFKDPTNPALALGADWINEDVRLVPLTATNVADFVSTAAVSALFSGAEILTAGEASHLQLTTVTSGAAGAVAGSPGGANSLHAAVVGNASASGFISTVAVSDSASLGLTGDTWVAVDNAVRATKNVISSGTALTSLSPSGAVELSTDAWRYSAGGPTTLNTISTWQVERHGRFVAYVSDVTVPSFANVREEDWVVIDPKLIDPAYPGAPRTMNSLNRGIFRVVRADAALRTFWIENPSAVPEVATADVVFLSHDSTLPGDSLLVNTAAWGANNLGSWTVKSIDLTSQSKFALDTSSRIPASAGPTAPLGASAGLVRVYEGQPSRLIKKIRGIVRTGPLADIQFSTNYGYTRINAANGSTISALDKLGLDSAVPSAGIDGYVHLTGLIAEASKVVYGDEAQTSTYPGIASAGDNIEIVGSMVKRISVALSLRVRTGIDREDIENSVRAAVAAVIDATPESSPVALGDLVAAAQTVNGVIAATMLSPTYDATHDIIAVQPGEKPRVINPKVDVLVSFAGVI
jgi:hypothetical protein